MTVTALYFCRRVYIYVFVFCAELEQILIYHFVAFTAEMSHKARKCLFQVETMSHKISKVFAETLSQGFNILLTSVMIYLDKM